MIASAQMGSFEERGGGAHVATAWAIYPAMGLKIDLLTLQVPRRTVQDSPEIFAFFA